MAYQAANVRHGRTKHHYHLLNDRLEAACGRVELSDALSAFADSTPWYTRCRMPGCRQRWSAIEDRADYAANKDQK